MIFFTSKAALEAWKARALAAEARVDDLLDRIATEPRIEVRPSASAAPVIHPDATNYITDEPYHDGVWNEFRGEPTEDEEQPA